MLNVLIAVAQKNLAQHFFLQNEISNPVDEYFIQHSDVKFHASFKPYLYSTLNAFDDQGVPYRHFSVHVYNLRKEFYDSTERKNKVSLQLLPQADIQQAYDMLGGRMLNETSGGLYTRLNINHNFSAEAQLLAGYVVYPHFTDTFVSSIRVIPGLGVAYKQGKPDNTGGITDQKYTFSNFSGSVSYNPTTYLNFQAGKGKLFVGDGYRSLLLSDAANNYPYFKSSLNIWRLQYNCWYSWFTDLYSTNGLKSNYRNKFGTFHYLSWNAGKRLNISLFENIIWAGSDSSRHRSFDPAYLNPVIFFRPVEFSNGSSDNALMGLNLSVKLFKRIKLYGQVVLDEFLLKEVMARKGWWANKQGYQAGFKYTDALGIKKLCVQGEFNYVRPYTFSHGSSQQNYAHFNQPLAHPLGANFYEVLGIITYRHHRYRLELKVNYALIGRDSSWLVNTNVGNNIFLSYNTRNQDYNNFTTQGIATTLLQADLKYSFYLIPNMNLRIEAGIIQRSLSNSRGFIEQTPFLYAGIKTSLYNFYRDF